jgi:glycolate oxidase iron-sulfur subunit
MHLVDHARAYREDLPPPADGPAAALGAGADPALPRAVPSGASRRQDRAARSPADAGYPAARDAGHGAEADAAGQPQRRPQTFPASGRAEEARGADDRLRAAGAQHRHQRRHHPAADPPLGCEVVVAEGHGLLRRADPPHGQEAESHATPREHPRLDGRDGGEGLDAIVINTSGCGTTVKDYGHMFRNDPLAEEAARSRASRWTSPRF